MLHFLALSMLLAPPCRELRDAHPRFSAQGDVGYENTKVAVLECAGSRALAFSRRENADAAWSEVTRIQVTAPTANQTWFFDGSNCAVKGASGDALLTNHAVLAHARAATGELAEWQPSEAWHLDLKKNKWVRDDAKKMTCHGDEP